MQSALQHYHPSRDEVRGNSRQQYQRRADTRQRPISSVSMGWPAVRNEQNAEDREKETDPGLYYYDDEFQHCGASRSIVLFEDQQEALVKAMLDFGRTVMLLTGLMLLSASLTIAAVRVHHVERQLAAQARV